MTRIVKTADVRRGEILDAAEALILHHGYQGMTMAQLMAEVGVAKGTLYHHFPSKEAILRGIVERQATQMLERSRQAAAAPASVVDRILAVIAGNRVSEDEDALVEHFNATRNAEFHLLALVALVRDIAPVLVALVEEGNASGELHCTDPLTTCEVLLAATGTLTDTGIFPDANEHAQRRIVGILTIAEELLGVPSGRLLEPALQTLDVRTEEVHS
ncbi:TetR/AcrR family transcriptional regulator [Schaalia sp. 19OD2882]|uniref:TetR/AcrR family transcriptional regulator n=1 Tax=Schaalia sp. 19OD2882 TaxID=2794089 RepID=UPI001C1EF28B|nr:TetR/AcrR family transcriptional regulator [Schaalia sp. 19OD2882]QWW19075.1 TetR/AcrR family transcriptional regulator [Schaalia sp. 19OD2882]